MHIVLRVILVDAGTFTGVLKSLFLLGLSELSRAFAFMFTS